jgi:histidinol-phosphatase
MERNDDLEFARRLADQADEITMARYRAVDLEVTPKSDRTSVTDADRAAEEVLRTRIARERGDAVAGEELGIEEGEVRWWLDPIDGTTQYARGLPIWATLIALERAGEVTVALASAPALGHRWWAERGRGAFMDGAQIHVSQVARLEEAYVSTTSVRTLPAFSRLAGRAGAARTYPDFWQYMLVAEGRIEIASDTTLYEWDIAATRLIVEEAGGRYTADDGLYLASNGLLHDEVWAILRARG